MTYEIYRYIFIGGAVLAGIMFVVSVAVFFLLKIPSVIGDLTGATARKAIENIRNQNEISGEKHYRPSQVQGERTQLTAKLSPSGKLIKDPTKPLYGASKTEKIDTQRFISPNASAETIELAGDSETTVLVPETHADETTLLEQKPAIDVGFVIEYEITYIHTDEVID